MLVRPLEAVKGQREDCSLKDSSNIAQGWSERQFEGGLKIVRGWFKGVLGEGDVWEGCEIDMKTCGLTYVPSASMMRRKIGKKKRL